MARHAHPGLVAIKADPSAQGLSEFSSGRLLGPRLVLTTRHGVAHADGTARPQITVSCVLGSRRAVRYGEPIPATMIWRGHGRLDAALLYLDKDAPSDFVPPLRWGEPVGRRPLTVTASGMPEAAFEKKENLSDIEHVTGQLDPATYTAGDRYAINLSSWPEGPGQWQGMSGSAVLAHTLLIGVIAWNQDAYANRRLTAVPLATLLTDPTFRAALTTHLGELPPLEPVELAHLFKPTRRHQITALGDLLRADAAVVDFVGRTDELKKLATWRDKLPTGPSDVSVMLVTGAGGQGKTRLAHHFLALSRQEDWAAGELHPTPLTDDDLTRLTSCDRPLLLLIDYVAGRTGQLLPLIEHIVRHRTPDPIRILLVARAGGSWWHDTLRLLNDLQVAADTLPLEALTIEPHAIFTHSLPAFAARLPSLTGHPHEDLTHLAASINPPPPQDWRDGLILTAQLRALVALLQACDPLPEGQAPEDTLLAHERKHRDELATARGLGHPHTRERAVTTAVLFGARGSDEVEARTAACRLIATALDHNAPVAIETQRAVASWIADLYPPATPGSSDPDEPVEFWGPMQPDRMAEFFLARSLDNEPDLPKVTGHLTDRLGASNALLVLSRAVSHNPAAARHIQTLVLAHPELFAPAALWVQTYAENPAPLMEALVRLGQTDPARLLTIVATEHDALPRFSLARLESAASFTHILTSLYRALTAHNRDAHLPALATSLSNHALRLSETGRRTEAVPVSEEALRLYSELAEQNRDAHLPALATSLHNHASYMSETGRRTEAVLLSEEALRLRRELAEQNRDAYLPDLATSLWVRAEVLDSDVENLTAAIAAAEEAVVLFEELVSVLPQAFEERLLAVRNLTAKLRRQRDRGAGPGQGGLVDLQPNAPCSCGSGKKYKRCHGAPS